MCGIVGIWSFSNKGEYTSNRLQNSMSSMRDSQSHRGPDATGELIDLNFNLFLGFCRLSFLDLSDRGNQPMEGTRWVIVFNGEIYNYMKLKQKLLLNYEFHSDSDTEVILALLERFGIESLKELDGMYAIAAFDKLEKKLHLIRDPFGEKPLYYTINKESGILAFSSELSGLEKSNLFELKIDKLSIKKYFLFQYITAPHTIYKNVYKLQPGEHLKFDSTGSRTSEIFTDYFRPKDIYTLDSSLETGELKKKIIDLLSESIEQRLLADVPIGAFLSSGVDSSLVVSIIRKVFGRQIETFSVGFEGSEDSEHFTASKIAKALGTEHNNLILAPNEISFVEDLGSLLDEPMADSSCFPTFMISKFSRSRVKGIITGDGGDELFGGYPRYLAALKENISRTEANSWDVYLPLISISDSKFNRIFNPSLKDPFDEYLASIESEFNNYKDINGISASMRYFDSKYYLPGAVLAKVDRMSMANSLETRTPFLERNLAELAMNLPHFFLFGGGKSKFILREVLSEFLPNDIANLPKKGFGFPLTEHWLKILDDGLRKIGSQTSNISILLGFEASQMLYQYLEKNGRTNPYLVWAAILLENWLEVRKQIIPELNISSKLNGSRTDHVFEMDNLSIFLAPVDEDYWLISEMDALVRFYLFTKIIRSKILISLLSIIRINLSTAFKSKLNSSALNNKTNISLSYDPFSNTEVINYLGTKKQILFTKIFLLLNRVSRLFSKINFSFILVNLFSKNSINYKLSDNKKQIFLVIHGQYFFGYFENNELDEMLNNFNKNFDVSTPLTLEEVDKVIAMGFEMLNLDIIFTKNIKNLCKDTLSDKIKLSIIKHLNFLNLNTFIFYFNFRKDSWYACEEVWFIEHATSLPLILSRWLNGSKIFRTIGETSRLFDRESSVEKYLLLRKIKTYFLQGYDLRKNTIEIH